MNSVKIYYWGTKRKKERKNFSENHLLTVEPNSLRIVGWVSCQLFFEWNISYGSSDFLPIFPHLTQPHLSLFNLLMHIRQHKTKLQIVLNHQIYTVIKFFI